MSLFLSSSLTVPAGAVQGFQNDGAGVVYAAVAHTEEHGNIPGKAQGTNCWYSYGGREIWTDDFSWVVAPGSVCFSKMQESPPWSATGHQNDGPLWTAIAHSPWGDIPGKAKGNTCWFAYGGEEKMALDFSYVAPGLLVKNDGINVPKGAVSIGEQIDAGHLYAVIAHTQWGDIPGKAQGNNCWFSYGGEEVYTTDFSWIVGNGSGSGDGAYPPPDNALPLGLQNDGTGIWWVAVAHSQWGGIPGKAQGNTCLFPYGGKEHQTNDFMWVTTH